MALRIRALFISALPALLLAGCSEPKSEGPIGVVAIGAAPKFTAAPRDFLDLPSAVLQLATAQGLVAFDSSGHIEPALAERWVVSDDGLSYIFRLRKIDMANGKPLTAQILVRHLRLIVSHRSGNPMAPLFDPVEEVIAVTPEIIELRLRSPRPQLLPLLAQAEAALPLDKSGGGGPFQMTAERDGSLLLKPFVIPDEEVQQAKYMVRLRGERAAVALARYDRGEADLVLGGSFADLPYARVLNAPSAQLKFDPALGLFGLGIQNREGFLSDPRNREAVAMVIDREALVQSQSIPGWRAVYSIVPERLDLAGEPAQPEWVSLPRAQRLEIARQRVAAWRSGQPGFPRLRIALPPGPGSKLLFSRLAVDLGQIGIIAERAEKDAPADLRLIDEVAPHDSASWFLRRLACDTGNLCTEAGIAALTASRNAETLSARSNLLSHADAAYMAGFTFIPIASPVRWSLVRPSLPGFRTNVRAAHPLHRLLKE